MRKLIPLVAFAALLVSNSSAHACDMEKGGTVSGATHAAEPASAAHAAPNAKGYDVKIEGMTCANCVEMVTDALKKVPGIDPKTVHVTLKKKEATFSLNETSNPQLNAQVKKAIEDAGYTVKMINGQKI